jgi:hypothetical protein
MSEKHLKQTLLALILVLAHSSVLACPQWFAEMDKGWDGKLNPEDITLVDDPLGGLQKVVKLTITEHSSWPNGHSRVELKHVGCTTAEGETTHISWQFYIDKPLLTLNDIAYWESDSSYIQAMGLAISPHQNEMTSGNEVRFYSNLPQRKIHWRQELAVGIWHEVSMEIHWSETKNGGQISLWFDQHKVIDGLKLQSKPDHNKMFIQIGLHRNQAEVVQDSIYLNNIYESAELQ